MKNMYKNKRESINSFSNSDLSSSIDLAWSESGMDERMTKSNLLRTVRSCYKLCKFLKYDSDEFLSKIRKRIDGEIVSMYNEKKGKKKKEKIQRKKREKDMRGDYCDTNITKHLTRLKQSKEDYHYTRSRQDEVTDIELENGEVMEVERGQTNAIESTPTNSIATTEGRVLRKERMVNKRKSERLKNKSKESY